MARHLTETAAESPEGNGRRPRRRHSGPRRTDDAGRTHPSPDSPPQGGHSRPTDRLLRAVEHPTVRVLAGLTFSVVLAALVVVAARSTVDLYFTTDAAHAVADADALLGRGVQPLRHAPVFPAIVALGLAVAGPVTATQLALGAALGALAGALLLLLRRWYPWPEAIVGAGVGTLAPTTAELLGWGGGPMLCGLAFLALALAANEWWIARGGPRGFAVGACLGLVAASHPYVLAVAVVVLTVRLAAHGLQSRSAPVGDVSPTVLGPTRPLGLVSVGVGAAPFAVLVVPYYSKLETGGGVSLAARPPTEILEFLQWSYRGGPWSLVLGAGICVAAVAWTRGGPRIVAVTFLSLIAGFALALSADASYVSRAAYFLVFPTAIGAAAAWSRLVQAASAGSATVRNESIAWALTPFLIVAAVGYAVFGPRLTSSTTWYQRLETADVPTVEALDAASGLVITTSTAHAHGEGLPNAWFVEGLAKTEATGPAAPWVTTLEGPLELARASERLLAGTEGLENGAIRVVGGPLAAGTDPAVHVRVDGFYEPAFAVNSLANLYPTGLGGTTVRELGDDRLTIEHYDTEGEPTVVTTASLDGRGVSISWELPDGVGPWSIWIYPAPGRQWFGVTNAQGGLEVTQQARSRTFDTFFYAGANADLVYHEVDPRFGSQAIELRGVNVPEVSLEVRTEGNGVPGPVRAFDQAALIASLDVSDILVWRGSMNVNRFDLSECFRRSGESPSLLRFSVVPGNCRAYGASDVVTSLRVLPPTVLPVPIIPPAEE